MTPTWSQRAVLALIDGALLGLFMVSVGVFVPLIGGPDSPVAHSIASPDLRRALIGVAMGLTAVALIYSPLGARSGAQMNPAVTLAFLRLGRIRPGDAAAYIACQFAGGLLGCLLIASVVGRPFSGAPIRYATTTPGPLGHGAALAAEFGIAFLMMLMVLYTSNTKRLAPYTGVFAGALVALYIAIEGPVSGMGLNPARTLASGLPAREFAGLWIYFAAPVVGMLAAAEVFARVRSLPAVHCCKLNHNHSGRCLHCGCDGPIDFDAHADEPR